MIENPGIYFYDNNRAFYQQSPIPFSPVPALYFNCHKSASNVSLLFCVYVCMCLFLFVFY